MTKVSGNNNSLKPDFFLVGAPKCGTTSMCHYLDQHPEIFISSPKEPFFFGSDLKGFRQFKDRESYLSLFQKGQNLLCGEGTTWYFFSEKAAQEIYSFNPDAKIIIMLRNPVDFMYSLHSELFYNHAESIENFEKALAAEKIRKQRGPDSLNPGIPPELFFYTDLASFTSKVKRYLDVFGRGRVHIILFDDFKQHTQLAYYNLLQFIEVNQDFKPDFEVLNSNKNIKSYKLHLLILVLKRIRSLLYPIISPEKSFRLINLIKRNNTSYQKRPSLDVNLRRKLQRQFIPEVEKLSELLDRDLSNWTSDNE